MTPYGWSVGQSWPKSLRLKPVDDIVISIVPIVLGDGTLFFDYVEQKIPLHLKDVTADKDGMVGLFYEVKKIQP